MNLGFYELRHLWTFFSVPLSVYLCYLPRFLWTLLENELSKKIMKNIKFFFLQYIDFFKNLNRYNSDVIIIIIWFLYRHNRKIKIRKNLYCINAFLCKPKAFLSLLIVSGLSFNLRIMIFSSTTTKILREKFRNNHLTLW